MIRFRSSSKKKILQKNAGKQLFQCYHMEHGRKSCRQQNISKRTMKRNEGALRAGMAAALLLVLFGRIRRWEQLPKQLNNQQRGQHRRLFRRKTGCRGWGCKQSRPLPRAVRAAKLCPRCSPSPGRELQIRRKKTIATILATTQGRNSNFKLA